MACTDINQGGRAYTSRVSEVSGCFRNLFDVSRNTLLCFHQDYTEINKVLSEVSEEE